MTAWNGDALPPMGTDPNILSRLATERDTERTRADEAEKRERELREAVRKCHDVLRRLRDFDGWDGTYHSGHAFDAKQDARAILDTARTIIQPEPDPLVEKRTDTGGYIVGNGGRTKWRAWQNGWSTWVDDPVMATRYYFRTDAMAAHQEDEDAWCIVPFAEVSIVKEQS